MKKGTYSLKVLAKTPKKFSGNFLEHPTAYARLEPSLEAKCLTRDWTERCGRDWREKN